MSNTNPYKVRILRESKFIGKINKNFIWKNSLDFRLNKDFKQLINHNKFNYQNQQLHQKLQLKENNNQSKDNYSTNKNISDSENNSKNENEENKFLDMENKKISFKQIFVYLKPYISKVKPLIFYSIALTILSKVFVSMVKKNFH